MGGRIFFLVSRGKGWSRGVPVSMGHPPHQDPFTIEFSVPETSHITTARRRRQLDSDGIACLGTSPIYTHGIRGRHPRADSSSNCRDLSILFT